ALCHPELPRTHHGWSRQVRESYRRSEQYRRGRPGQRPYRVALYGQNLRGRPELRFFLMLAPELESSFVFLTVELTDVGRATIFPSSRSSRPACPLAPMPTRTFRGQPARGARVGLLKFLGP